MACFGEVAPGLGCCRTRWCRKVTVGSSLYGFFQNWSPALAGQTGESLPGMDLVKRYRQIEEVKSIDLSNPAGTGIQFPCVGTERNVSTIDRGTGIVTTTREDNGYQACFAANVFYLGSTVIFTFNQVITPTRISIDHYVDVDVQGNRVKVGDIVSTHQDLIDVPAWADGVRGAMMAAEYDPRQCSERTITLNPEGGQTFAVGINPNDQQCRNMVGTAFGAFVAGTQSRNPISITLAKVKCNSRHVGCVNSWHQVSSFEDILLECLPNQGSPDGNIVSGVEALPYASGLLLPGLGTHPSKVTQTYVLWSDTYKRNPADGQSLPCCGNPDNPAP